MYNFLFLTVHLNVFEMQKRATLEKEMLACRNIFS